MPSTCIVDSGALVALLDPREEHHVWAREALSRQPLPWFTCESVLSEALFLLHEPHLRALDQLLRQGHLRLALNLADELLQVLDLRAKYSSVPMSLADACLVRLSETLPDPVVVTTDVRVEPAVARRLPHRPVRAQFAHTVPPVTGSRGRWSGRLVRPETQRFPAVAGSSAPTSSPGLLDCAAAAICATA